MNKEELVDYMGQRGFAPEEINVVELVKAYELIMKHNTVGNALEKCVKYEREIEEGKLMYNY